MVDISKETYETIINSDRIIWLNEKNILSTKYYLITNKFIL